MTIIRANYCPINTYETILWTTTREARPPAKGTPAWLSFDGHVMLPTRPLSMSMATLVFTAHIVCDLRMYNFDALFYFFNPQR